MLYDLEGGKSGGDHIYARIWSTVAHDLIIAVTAISPDYNVATANIRDFERILGLKVGKLPLP